MSSISGKSVSFEIRSMAYLTIRGRRFKLCWNIQVTTTGGGGGAVFSGSAKPFFSHVLNFFKLSHSSLVVQIFQEYV